MRPIEEIRPEAGALADAFCAVLNEWLSPAEMAEIVRRNMAEQNKSICHSHDFYDANQAMIDAWQRVTGGGEPDIDSEDEAQASRINEAWAIAKGRNFK